MKMITAIVQPDKIDAVSEALIKKDITRITVGRVAGHGQKVEEDLYRGQEVGINLSPKIRIEIACNEDFVEEICNIIIESARHEGGKLGDGKIFISSLDECIRIRTGERGKDAI